MLLSDLATDFFGGTLPRRTVFRLDGGQAPRLAYGHLVRCQLVSEHLRAMGRESCMLMRREADGMAWARNRGETLVDDSILKTLGPDDALVSDLPFGPESNIVDKARKQGAMICTIDDGTKDIGPCDVVLNSSILATPLWYPDARRTLLGPEYFIMDTHWANSSWQTSGQDKPRVLLTFGGADPSLITPRVVEAINSLNLNLDLQVVLGPGYAGPTVFPGWKIHNSPKDLLPLLLATDLLVCAGGRTVYEGYLLGVPTMCIGTTEYEGQVAFGFVQNGLNEYGLSGWDEAAFVKQFPAAVDSAIRKAKRGKE